MNIDQIVAGSVAIRLQQRHLGVMQAITTYLNDHLTPHHAYEVWNGFSLADRRLIKERVFMESGELPLLQKVRIRPAPYTDEVGYITGSNFAFDVYTVELVKGGETVFARYQIEVDHETA